MAVLPHVCEICDEQFDTERALLEHDCPNEFDSVDGLLDSDLVTDGGENTTQGAIDNDFEDAERDAREILEAQLAEAGAPTHADGIKGGDVALDLVSRQPLYVVRVAAPDLPSYYESEEFDLATYKGHSWLPVRLDDPVLECIFIPTSVESLHKVKKTYDYPAGRLARVPLGLAMEEDDG